MERARKIVDKKSEVLRCSFFPGRGVVDPDCCAVQQKLGAKHPSVKSSSASKHSLDLAPIPTITHETPAQSFESSRCEHCLFVPSSATLSTWLRSSLCVE